jgi:UDP-N-acetylmuramoylalanine--D-glutamate ligase
MSGRFAGSRAVVVGAGVAGSSAARALLAEGAEVRITERRAERDIEEGTRLGLDGVELLAGGHRPQHLEGATVVVVSPGVPPDAEVLGWARAEGIPVWGELELGARLVEVPYIGVTGTNGKTTTTGMIESCLRAEGLDAVACGNIGRPFPEAAREAHDVLVVECSSFQLEMQGSFHPSVSVLLNLAPDHLDWHGSDEAYRRAKARIFGRQAGADVHVGNADDEQAAALSAAAPCEVRWFRLGEPHAGEVGYVGDALVVGSETGVGELGPAPSPGPALRVDAAAAASAALAFGARPDAVAAGLATYEPHPHRGEVVAVVRGVRFVDDSKATNVHAALAAIDAHPGSVLIAGGRAKGVDLSPLATRAGQLAGVVAIGESATQIVASFRGSIPAVSAGSIEEATALALDLCEPGGTVLLAPACASWDQFRDYAERGERFAAAARGLQGVRAGG